MLRSRALLGPVLALAVLATAASASAQGPKITYFPTPPGDPRSIVVGPDRNLWFTVDSGGNYIGRMTPQGRLSTFPTPGPAPDTIVVGPDRNLWFTERGGNALVRMTTSGEPRSFPLGTPGGFPRGLAVGPDGNFWMAEFGADQVSRMTPDGQYTPLRGDIAPEADPLGVVRGPDDNLWFTEAEGDRIVRVTPGGQFRGFEVSEVSGPEAITVGPDGHLWFTEDTGDRIGRITVRGQVREFSAGITPGANPFGIAEGPDGGIWFTEFDGHRLGRATPDGYITEYRLKRGAAPMGLVTGPDGNIWVALSGTDEIARVVPPPAPRIPGTVTLTYGGSRSAVRFTRASVTGAPRVARIVVLCTGPRAACPVRRVSRRARSLNLLPRIDGPLRPGGTLRIRVSAPGYSDLLRILEFRRSGTVRSRTLCVPPGRAPRRTC